MGKKDRDYMTKKTGFQKSVDIAINLATSFTLIDRERTANLMIEFDRSHRFLEDNLDCNIKCSFEEFDKLITEITQFNHKEITALRLKNKKYDIFKPKKVKK